MQVGVHGGGGEWPEKVSWEMEKTKKGLGRTREEGCMEEIR